jgi:hypothetical protein
MSADDCVAFDRSVLRMAVGLAFSLGVGQLVTRLFLHFVRRGLGEKPQGASGLGPKRLSPWITGTTERLVFTIFVAALPSASIGPMIGWIALKLAANWNHPHWKDDPDARTFAVTAALAGLVSMCFAFVGGMIANGTFWVGI